MWRKLVGIVLGVCCVAMVAGVAEAAAKKAARKPKESTESMIRRAVEEAIKDSVPATGGKFEYLAKRMRPPKNKKWTGRWNELGQEGWQMVGNNENIYIFQRPGHVDLAAAGDKKVDKKAEKAAAADSKKANKEAEKAAKEADKQAQKAAKEADRAAKKAAKDAAKNAAPAK